MKMHVITATFILFCALTTFSQENVVLDRSTAESALKAIKLVPELEAKIETLEKLLQAERELKVSPCQNAINYYKEQLLTLPFDSPDFSKEKNRQIKQLRNDVRKGLISNYKKQCDIKDNSLLQFLLQQLPNLILILKKG